MAAANYQNLFLQPSLLPEPDQTRAVWLEDAGTVCHSSDKEFLAAVFFAAPHLRQTAQQFSPDQLHHMITNPHEAIRTSLANWEAHVAHVSSDDTFMSDVRKLRAEIWLIIAIGEISGILSMQECYTFLSQTAERVLVKTVQWLCVHNPAFPDINDSEDSLAGSGYIVLALGKLGAKELNYSSDLDLIILHDSQSTNIDRSVFIAMTRRLIHLLSAQTKDGFAFRIDLRLRPDPGATSISIEQSAALIYYESQARTWERSAFIRGRPIAGNIAAAEQFLSEIQPFIWRRYLDYTVIEDLQVWLQKKPTPENMLGFDVKNGAFGIRHIELLTHSLQLLNGGRHKTLRTYSTHSALQELARLELMSADNARALQSLYDAWRQVEHRLQYQRDAHLYRLPSGEDDFAIFARFAGFETADRLRDYIHHLQHETDHAARHPVLSKLFGKTLSNLNQTPSDKAPANQSWIDTSETRLEWLVKHGFTGAETINQTIEGWLSGRIAATRSPRSQQYLLKLLPALLTQLAASEEADDAFSAFADIIAGQPAGAQIFALLEFHPKLVGLLLDILTSAPELVGQIRRHPDLMELLLEPSFYAKLPDISLTVDENDPVEIQLDHIRRQVRQIQFGISIHQLQHLSDEADIALAWSAVAEQATNIIMGLAKTDMIRRHGPIDADLALIGLGSFGRKTMSAHSDLDLIAIYNGDLQSNSEGDEQGKRAIGLSAYMLRLTQTIVSWLTIQTAEGALFTVDMRLRPDGKSGPVAVHMDRIISYYQTEAWPWEHLALDNARVFAANPDFLTAASLQLKTIQSQPLEKSKLASDLIKMRGLLHQTHKADDTTTNWQLKRLPGGTLDCKLLIQLSARFEVISVSADEEEALQRIEYVSRWLQVGLGRKLNIDTLPNRMGGLLAQHLHMPDQSSVRVQLETDMQKLAHKLDHVLQFDLTANP